MHRLLGTTIRADTSLLGAGGGCHGHEDEVVERNMLKGKHYYSPSFIIFSRRQHVWFFEKWSHQHGILMEEWTKDVWWEPNVVHLEDRDVTTVTPPPWIGRD